MNNLKTKTLKAVQWQILKIGFSLVINFGYLAVVARYVSQESFGILAIANGSLALITFFSEFGFGAALIQKASITKEEISSAFNLTMLLSISIAVVILAFAKPISVFYSEPILFAVIALLGVILLIRGIGIVSNALLIRDLDYRSLFIADVTGMFIGNMIVGSILAIYGYDIWSLVGAYLIGAIITVFLKLCFKPISIKLPTRNDFNEDFKYILKFGFSLTGVRLIHQVAQQADKLILGKVMSKDIVGLYDKSYYLAGVPLQYYGSAMDGVLFSGFSRFQDNLTKLREHFYSFLLLSLTVFSFISISLYFRAKDVILLLLGDNWLGSVDVFKVLSLLIPFMVLSRFSDTYIRARNLFSKAIYVKLVYLIAICSSVMLMYPQGIEYVGIGILVAGIIHAILLLGMCIADLGSSWSDFLSFIYRLGITLLIVCFTNYIASYIIQYIASDTAWINLLICGSALLISGLLMLRKFKLIFGIQMYQYIKSNFNHPLINKIIV